MRVAIHQPHYLPWLGLIDKIDRCDLFVYLDDVQYERRGWQNRNYIASKDGPVLLTVPVIQRSRNELINEKRIDTEQGWAEKHRRAIAHSCYRNAPYWRELGPQVVDIYDQRWENLADLAIMSTNTILKQFGVDTPSVRSSELGEFVGQKSHLIAQISAKLGATSMLSGDGARGYMDEEAFIDHGITLEWQNFQHPTYEQFSRAEGDFLPRMAALDLLMNEGPAGIDILRAARADEPHNSSD